MFNTVGITRGLSLTKIIGGLSKTLQIANQVIPLYQKAKPMISNARSIMSALKGIKSSPKIIEAENTPIIKSNSSQNQTIKKEKATSPTFFL